MKCIVEMANETDRTVPNNKSDIIICDKEKRNACVKIDVAISGDRDVIKK
jgi:hypothetical protein